MKLAVARVLALGLWMVVSWWTAGVCEAQELDSRIQQASEAFDAGQYERSVGLFNEVLLNSPDPNPLALYNLGVLAFKLERHGAAIYYFRRALGHGTGEVAAGAEYNLEVTRQALLEKHKSRIEKGVVSYETGHGPLYAIFSLVPRGLAASLLVLSALVAFFGLMGWTFLQRGGVRSLARSFFLAAVLPLVVSGVAFYGRCWVDESWQLGVVVSVDAQLVESPTEGATGTALAEGLEVRLLDASDPSFVKIEVSRDKTGYVRAVDVWPLDQPRALR